MKIIGKKEHVSLAPGASEVIGYDVSKYLGGKSAVTLVSAAWSSSPPSLGFSGQTETATVSSVLVSIPESASRVYEVKCKMTFSDGAVRTACAPLRVVCDG